MGLRVFKSRGRFRFYSTQAGPTNCRMGWVVRRHICSWDVIPVAPTLKQICVSCCTVLNPVEMKMMFQAFVFCGGRIQHDPSRSFQRNGYRVPVIRKPQVKHLQPSGLVILNSRLGSNGTAAWQKSGTRCNYIFVGRIIYTLKKIRGYLNVFFCDSFIFISNLVSSCKPLAVKNFHSVIRRSKGAKIQLVSWEGELRSRAMG